MFTSPCTWKYLNELLAGTRDERVTVQLERYSSFDPDRWWETRDGIRTEIVEFQKLVLDRSAPDIISYIEFRKRRSSERQRNQSHNLIAATVWPLITAPRSIFD